MRTEAEIRATREEHNEMMQLAKRRGDYIHEALFREKLKLIEWILEER